MKAAPPTSESMMETNRTRTYTTHHKIKTMKPTENLSTDTEATADSLYAMLKRERTTHSCHDGYLNTSDPSMITAEDRKMLVDWCYGVVDHCQYSRETVASAMNMVDRFLSMPSNSAEAARVCDEALRDQTKFQLLTIAALYSSIKVNERVVMSSELFSEICSRCYTAQEIEGMERILLSGLSWRCHSTTAHQVGMSILSLLLPYVDIPEVTWGFIMDEMKYLTELAVRDYYFTTLRTSTVALASIFSVISDTTTRERQQILGAFLNTIMECFDFDHADQIDAARRRLRTHTRPDTVEDDMDDGISLAESVKTFKASNSSSSQKRRRQGTGSGNVVTPNSSMHDLMS